MPVHQAIRPDNVVEHMALFQEVGNLDEKVAIFESESNLNQIEPFDVVLFEVFEHLGIGAVLRQPWP